MYLIHSDINIGNYKLINFVNLSDKEIEMVRKWRNSEKIRKWMLNDKLISAEEHIRFIKSLKETKSKVYWLVMKDKQHIGVIYFTDIMWNHRNAYLGVYVNPENISQGNGKILLTLILDIGFNLFRFHSLRLEVIEDNHIAISLYKKFSFKEEGRLREFVFRDGNWKDVIIMGMINPQEKKGEENEN
ncbi:UDP-4-amino-4,6-dideoxy-N-acetyl-beta-L-altrosamine N-acetyltransferase [Persephonella sp.]